jgi:hypothetical protein
MPTLLVSCTDLLLVSIFLYRIQVFKHGAFEIWNIILDSRKPLSIIGYWSLPQVYCVCFVVMENDDARELPIAIHHHEDLIHANHSALLIVSSKISEMEQACITQNANIMSILLQQK